MECCSLQTLTLNPTSWVSDSNQILIDSKILPVYVCMWCCICPNRHRKRKCHKSWRQLPQQLSLSMLPLSRLSSLAQELEIGWTGEGGSSASLYYLEHFQRNFGLCFLPARPSEMPLQQDKSNISVRDTSISVAVSALPKSMSHTENRKEKENRRFCSHCNCREIPQKIGSLFD